MQTNREISYWAAFPWKAYVIATVCVLGSLACAAPVPQTDIEVLAAAEMQQITDHPATDIEPKWSPNSERLAFASDRDGGLDVYTVEVEGGKPTRLTEGMKFVHSTWWSPSGGSLVMSAGAKTWDRDIFLYLVSVPGGEMRPLTNGPIDGSPCWSPDGKKIAFVSNRSGHFDLWVIPAEGGEAVQITDFEGLDHSPRWSPDGSRLAFHSRRSGNEDIWITPAAAGESTQLTRSPANDSYAAWSPDGRWIAFNSSRGGRYNIWAIPAGGGEPVQLTSGPGNKTRPAWSPDGRSIAFTYQIEGNPDIWMISAP